MPNIFMISDTHLDHETIRYHCNRPFATLDEMNNAIVTNWNDVVGDQDTIFILGDFAWKRHGFWINELKGRKIMIFGNHDKMRVEHQRCFSASYGDSRNPGIHQNTLDGQYVVMSHYPLYSWNGSFHGAYSLYGHCHGRKRESYEDVGTGVITDEFDQLPPPRIPEYEDGLACAVDVDAWEYAPVPWEVIKAKLSSRLPAFKERMIRIAEASKSKPFDYPSKLASANHVWRVMAKGGCGR